MQKEVNVEVEVAMEMEEFNKRVGHILTNPTISLTKRNKFFLEIVRDFREKLPDQKLRCKICNFVSKRADHLKTHLARHANLKLYACGTCEKVFMRYR